MNWQFQDQILIKSLVTLNQAKRREIIKLPNKQFSLTETFRRKMVMEQN